MNYLRLLRQEGPLLWFGLVTALSTSFGQTFFIALSVPVFLREFALGEAQFGLMYSLATVLGALALPYTGALIDRTSLPRYTTFVVVALAVASLLVALSPHVLVLAAGILGLRMVGQGLLGHVSMTVMAREFHQNRGKALGFASLGYPLGEAILPALFASLVYLVSWRAAWLAIAAALLLVVLPGLLLLLKQHGGKAPAAETIAAVKDGFDARMIWRDWRLYCLLPAVLALPFVQTGLFLYQLPLAESKGWSAALIASAFTAYALSRALSSIFVGPIIDRFSAARLAPVYLLPNALGLGILLSSSATWVAPVYLVMVGVSGGCSSSIVSSIWAEFYGPEHVGKVRSAITSLTVMSTAGAPLILGFLLEYGTGFPAILIGGIVVMTIASVIAVPATPWASALPGMGLLRALRARS
ncbi:MAG: MFS transporter [Bryobacterales bacterium]|nr:MFS transporter [Bryobacterales bacterium]